MSESHIEHHSRPDATIGHETTDISPKTLLLWTASLLVIVVVTALFVKVVYTYHPMIQYGAGEGVNNQYGTPEAIQQMPEPKLESVPGSMLQEYVEEQAAITDTYGWVDKNAGVVRIPIDRAIDIIAEKGLPTRSGDGARPQK